MSYTIRCIIAVVIALISGINLLEYISRGDLIPAFICFIVFGISAPLAYYYYERRKSRTMSESEVLAMYEKVEHELKTTSKK